MDCGGGRRQRSCDLCSVTINNMASGRDLSLCGGQCEVKRSRGSAFCGQRGQQDMSQLYFNYSFPASKNHDPELSCGMSTNLRSLIFLGQNAALHEFPWQAHLNITFSSKCQDRVTGALYPCQSLCGGSLIDSQNIAQCS